MRSKPLLFKTNAILKLRKEIITQSTDKMILGDGCSTKHRRLCIKLGKDTGRMGVAVSIDAIPA